MATSIQATGACVFYYSMEPGVSGNNAAHPDYHCDSLHVLGPRPPGCRMKPWTKPELSILVIWCAVLAWVLFTR